jgi:hypothetical protein
MSFVDSLIANLRGNGVLYLVCVLGIIGCFKLLGRHPQQKKFMLIGIFLLLGSAILGALFHALAYQVIVGDTTPRFEPEKWHEANRTYVTVSGIIHFLSGAAHAAGIASLLYAMFVDKFTVSAKKSRGSRRYEEIDEEEDRPRRSRRRDEDDEDDRPRRRPRRDDDD